MRLSLEHLTRAIDTKKNVKIEAPQKQKQHGNAANRYTHITLSILVGTGIQQQPCAVRAKTKSALNQRRGATLDVCVCLYAGGECYVHSQRRPITLVAKRIKN